MALTLFLNNAIINEEGRHHVEDRHIKYKPEKSRFTIPKERIFELIWEVILEAREDNNKLLVQLDNGYDGYIDKVILRKEFDYVIGTAIGGKREVKAMKVVITRSKLKTAYPIWERLGMDGKIKDEEQEEEEALDSEGYYMDKGRYTEEELIEEEDDDDEVYGTSTYFDEKEHFFEELWD